MKQKLSLCIVILLVLETICFFVPGCIRPVYWKVITSGIQQGHLQKTYPDQVFNIFYVDPAYGLAIALTVVMIASLGLFLLVSLRPNIKLEKVACFSSFISLAVLVAYTYYTCAIAQLVFNDSSRYEWTIGWLYYIIIALHILTVILSLVVKYKKFEDREAKANNSNTPEEIKKYKELLDSGVISQDEFDAKKKQLLGL